MNGSMFFHSLNTNNKQKQIKGNNNNLKKKAKCEKSSNNKCESNNVRANPKNSSNECINNKEIMESKEHNQNNWKQKESTINLYSPIVPSNNNENDFTAFSFANNATISPVSSDAGFSSNNGFNYHLNNEDIMYERMSQFPEPFNNNFCSQQLPKNYNLHCNNNNNNVINGNNNNEANENFGNRSNNTGPNTTNNNNKPNNSYNNNNNNYYEHQRKKYSSTNNNNNKSAKITDPMYRRVHGLTHRLKSRTELMRIDQNPKYLLNGGAYDHLSQSIYDIFTSKSQKTETYENKIQLWSDLFLYIRKCMQHYALYIVGSTMTGFGLDSSDVDMCILIKPSFTDDPRLDSLQQLHTIKNHLLKYGLIIHSELILAKVPILKFREETKGFEIDLNCNNAVGIYNTHLLSCYAQCDWRVRPLVIMVKLWAQANGINDAKNLTVSSYSWTLMLIHYLQCGVSPLVLPCLHSLYPTHFNGDKMKITDVQDDLYLLEDLQSFNTQSLAELFIGFFEYYTNFDFTQYAISVRAGCRLLIENCKSVKAPKNDQNQWRYLCIEEPFDLTNTARSVYDIAAFRHIKTIITRSYEELIRTKMLTTILPVSLISEQIYN